MGAAVLVARERRARMKCAAVVPQKGAIGVCAAERLMAFLRAMGLDEVMMNSDGEAAIKAVMDDLAGSRPTAKTMCEEAPPRVERASNQPIVERTV